MAVLKQQWFSADLTLKEVLWNLNCDALEEYGRQHGTCNCPRDTVCILHNGEELNIGKWLKWQRTCKKGTTGSRLTKDREARLQRLVDEGRLLWDIRGGYHVRSWDFMYNVLVEYGNRTGTCNVPAKWRETLPGGEEVNLGSWVSEQRRHRNDSMSEDHRKRLQLLVDQGIFRWRMVSVSESPIKISLFADCMHSEIFIRTCQQSRL